MAMDGETKDCSIPSNGTLHSKGNFCHICEKHFINIQTHAQRNHQTKHHKCDICDKEFFDKSVLKTHLKIRTEELKAFCKICKKSFSDKHKLKRHLTFVCQNVTKVHQDQVKCCLCENVYKSRVSFSNHWKSIHETTEQKCEMCDKSFVFKNALKYHLTKVHGRTSKNVCNICTKSFQTNHDLSKHISTCHANKESMKFKCNSCSKEFKEKRSLIQHQIVCQAKPENLRCGFCEKLFDFKIQLDHHIKRVHHEQKYRCEQCGKIFARLQFLKIHLEGIHLGENSKCVICGMKFSSERNMKQHLIQVHNEHGNSRSKCDICDEFFNSDTMKGHVQRIHMKNNKLSCHICSQTFDLSRYLIRHLIEHKSRKISFWCDL